MTKPFACHYSVVRFSPYPETDEFVNVGVVFLCATIGYFDYMRADLRRRGRVGRFFPELDVNIYAAALHAWEDSVKAHKSVPDQSQTLASFDQQRWHDLFKTLVRPRESILFYSEPRVILSEDPAATLDEIFGAYVERRFAHAPEYQETVMCRRLESAFREANILQRFRLGEPVGDENYRVRFPFVKWDGGARPRQAIKALHLDRDNPTDILRHADDWRTIVSRLRSFETAPDELLFILQGPSHQGPAHQRMFGQVRRDLDQDGIPHVLAEATPDILAFATH